MRALICDDEPRLAEALRDELAALWPAIQRNDDARRPPHGAQLRARCGLERGDAVDVIAVGVG